jgi:hypothetical protein
MSASVEHAAALEYAGRSQRVFPVGIDKKPLTTHGFKDATTDPAMISRWWTEWPRAGIATPTGPDWFVLDADDLEALQRLQHEHGALPPTWTVVTPRPGLHTYLLGKVTNGRGQLPAGLDVRGAGGYVLLPPSPHVNGVYEWRTAPGETPIAPAPAWLLAVLGAGKVSSDSAPPVEGQIPAGERNSTLCSMAGTMRRRGLSERAIEAALLVEYEDRCAKDDTMTEADVSKIARSISRYVPDDDAVTSFEQLNALLGLDAVGKRISKVAVFGRGSSGAAYIHLDSGQVIVLDPIGHFLTAPKLSAELGLVAGVKKMLKGPDVNQACSLIHALAGHEQTFDDDDRALDLGAEYLRLAPIANVTMADQVSRWKTFSHLEGHLPAQTTDRTGLVLEDLSTGLRYVRCSWFGDWLDARSGPGESRVIGRSMAHLGWLKPGGKGRIKATALERSEALAWAFFVVPKDWGNDR